MPGSGIALLAEKVESREQFELAKKLGYTYFQGYFFAKPTVVSSADISLLQAKCLRILQKTFDPDYDPKELAAVIKQEPSLCYRLLRYLDSAVFGLYPIRSIDHALVILGQRETQKWVALLTAVMLGKKTTTALVSMALIRARFCELMAGELDGPSTDYFLVGLLSLMDVLLSQPMSAVLAQLPISVDCRAALEGTDNSISKVLQLGIACERGEWGALSRQCSALGTAESVAWSLYSQAIEWARSFASAAVGAADYFFLFLPGRAAGFSWMRSRKSARMPAPSETAPSPNLSRSLSAAPIACRQRSSRAPGSRCNCASGSANIAACTPSNRINDPGLQFRRKSSRTIGNSSVSSWLGCSRVRARVKVLKSA